MENVIACDPRYIGIIGSKARIALLLEGLKVPKSLHAPVGLSIGGEGPEEIAVSIVAELIQVRRAHSRKIRKDGVCFENSRHLFGGGSEQPDGAIESFA
ncbi:putative xanthine dehydrogenase subunit A [compost metagenome]